MDWLFCAYQVPSSTEEVVGDRLSRFYLAQSSLWTDATVLSSVLYSIIQKGGEDRPNNIKAESTATVYFVQFLQFISKQKNEAQGLDSSGQQQSPL